MRGLALRRRLRLLLGDPGEASAIGLAVLLIGIPALAGANPSEAAADERAAPTTGLLDRFDGRAGEGPLEQWGNWSPTSIDGEGQMLSVLDEAAGIDAAGVGDSFRREVLSGDVEVHATVSALPAVNEPVFLYLHLQDVEGPDWDGYRLRIERRSGARSDAAAIEEVTDGRVVPLASASLRRKLGVGDGFLFRQLGGALAGSHRVDGGWAEVVGASGRTYGHGRLGLGSGSVSARLDDFGGSGSTSPKPPEGLEFGVSDDASSSQSASCSEGAAEPSETDASGDEPAPGCASMMSGGTVQLTVDPNPTPYGGLVFFGWTGPWDATDCWDNFGNSGPAQKSWYAHTYSSFLWEVWCYPSGYGSVQVNVGSNPTGWFDAIDTNGLATGWACDVDDPNAQLEVHFFSDGPYGVGTYRGGVIANTSSAAGLCGGSVLHGFAFPVPDALKNGVEHTLYAYAVNVGGGSENPLLGGSPRSFRLLAAMAPPTVSPAGPVTEPAWLSTSPGTWYGAAEIEDYAWLRNDVQFLTGLDHESYLTGVPDRNRHMRSRVTACTPDRAVCGSADSSNAVYVNAGRAPAVSQLAPAANAVLPTANPLLSAVVSDADGDELDVLFQVATDPACPDHTVVVHSGWLPHASQDTTTPSLTSWTVPPGRLKDGRTYWWCFWAQDYLEGPVVIRNQRFDVRLPKLGVRDYWPMWSRGPVSVNLATGNLVVSVPGPSYPTAVGSMGASATYNSRDAGNRGLGPGWTLAAGDELASPPTKLVDHNLLSGSDQFDAIERVSADGSSDFYTRIGTTNTYESAPGDGSQLTRGADGSWTLIDPDAAIYLFAASHVSGAFPLVSAELGDATPGSGALRYTFGVANGSDRLRVTGIADSPAGQPPGRSLAFTWNELNQACTALVCMTGPRPDGVTWRYIGDAQGRLWRINNGVRDVLQLSYDANGRLSKVQNANDLDPAGAGPGYNGAHALSITYDGNGRVASVSEGPVTNQTPAVSTWSFGYTPGDTTVTRPTRAAHGAMNVGAVRAADGYTEVTPPRQQGLPTPKRSRVYYDALARPLEQVDLLGNVTSTQYNDRDQFLWSEDEQERPTDYTYDPVNDVLTAVTGPDPDGPGPLARPVTSNRYDEFAIGTAGAEGPKLQGLQASYYTNRNFAGRPHARTTDANVNFHWGTGGPALLGGVTDEFSVRWTGNIVVPSSGAYTFTTVADDGTRLAIDGVLAIDHWIDQGFEPTHSQPTQLAAGLHKISLEYYENLVSADVELRWACTSCAPAVPYSIIPSANLRPAWLNQTSTVSPSGRVSFSHVADPAKGLVDYTLQRANGIDHLTSFTYDNHGRITQKVMPKGNANRAIDANGNLQGVPDTRFATTWTYYAPAEEAVVPALGACAAATVNQAALLKQIATHGLAAVTHVYDAAGRSVKTTRGSGATERCYDAEGSLKNEKAPGEAQATTYTYDPAGRQLTTTDGSGTVTTEHDEAGRVKRSVDSFGAEATFTYDAEGNQIRRRAAKGLLASNPQYETTFAYDELGRLASLTDPAAKTYAFFYDERDALRATQYPNGTFSWNDYNQTGWLTATYNRHGTLTPPLTSVPADASPIVDFAYTYNLEGQRTQETRSGGGISPETTTYVYDALGRLEQATLPGGSSRRYCFDRDSNRTEITASAATACGSPSPVASYTYDPNSTPGVDQLTSVTQSGQTRSFTYNTDGDVTQRGNDILNWDGRGRFKGGSFSGRTLTYGFDAAGFRRERTTTGLTYRSEVLADAPTSYWRLGEASGTAMTDDRAANPGAYVNGVTLASAGALASDPNSSASLDGSNDHATVANATSLNASSQLTLEAWVKPRAGSFSSQKPVLLKSYTSHALPFYQYGLFLNNASSQKLIRFSLTLNGTHTNLDVANSGWQFGVWNHLAATYDGQTMRLYRNGTQIGSRTATGTISSYATPLLVGAYGNLAKTSTYLFGGEIDEAALYAAALPAARIQAHYSAGVSAPSTTRYLHGGLFETTSSGTITLTDVDGLAGDLAHYAGAPETATTTTYLYYNGHGDLAATANQAGVRTNAYTYDPFGAPLETPPADKALERYTGRWDKKLDTTSGLIEMGARPYDPVLGRFMAVDPIEGGSLNTYDYAAQDPVNAYDLDGLSVDPRIGGVYVLVDSKNRVRYVGRSAGDVWGRSARSAQYQMRRYEREHGRKLKLTARVVFEHADDATVRGMEQRALGYYRRNGGADLNRIRAVGRNYHNRAATLRGARAYPGYFSQLGNGGGGMSRGPANGGGVFLNF